MVMLPIFYSTMYVGLLSKKRNLMKEPGVSSFSGLILDENKIYRLNLRKAGISVEFDGGK